MSTPKLYMILAGCKPEGRYTEQHDVFFGIASSLKELIPHLNHFWKEAKGNLHIDAWREVNIVDGFKINVIERDHTTEGETKLYFLNLGGYRKGEFEEYHSKMLVTGNNSAEAIKKGKATFFYKETGFKGAASHVDDKYALDVDDVYAVEDILAPAFKTKYSLQLLPAKNGMTEDKIHLGYLQLWKIKDNL